MCTLLYTQDWVNYHQEDFHQIVPCLNMSKINFAGSDSKSLNQHWLFSPVELNCLLASHGSLLFWPWWSQRPSYNFCHALIFLTVCRTLKCIFRSLTGRFLCLFDMGTHSYKLSSLNCLCCKPKVLESVFIFICVVGCFSLFCSFGGQHPAPK